MNIRFKALRHRKRHLYEWVNKAYREKALSAQLEWKVLYKYHCTKSLFICEFCYKSYYTCCSQFLDFTRF